MMRQHVREVDKRVLTVHLVESILTSGNILKLLPIVASGNYALSIIVIYISLPWRLAMLRL